MIDDKQYSSLNNQDIYQLYVKTYKKLEEKEIYRGYNYKIYQDDGVWFVYG